MFPDIVAPVTQTDDMSSCCLGPNSFIHHPDVLNDEVNQSRLGFSNVQPIARLLAETTTTTTLFL